MHLIPLDVMMSVANFRPDWSPEQVVYASRSEAWASASRHLIYDLRDEQGYPYPLIDGISVAVYPLRGEGLWRAEAERLPLGVIGRGKSPEDALADWRRRFRALLQRFLEMRPFEMSIDDKEQWEKFRAVVDVPRYRASKPLTIRQLGKVVRMRGGFSVVQWEDGSRERVDPALFDESFSRFRIGQPFEAMVTRKPQTFRILRAEAVRKLAEFRLDQKRSGELWEAALGKKKLDSPENQAEALDENFWLKKLQ